MDECLWKYNMYGNGMEWASIFSSFSMFSEHAKSAVLYSGISNHWHVPWGIIPWFDGRITVGTPGHNGHSLPTIDSPGIFYGLLGRFFFSGPLNHHVSHHRMHQFARGSSIESPIIWDHYIIWTIICHFFSTKKTPKNCLNNWRWSIQQWIGLGSSFTEDEEAEAAPSLSRKIMA